MRKLLLAFALCTLFAGLASAQTPTTPDFSGIWKLNLVKSTVPKKIKLSPETITITTDGDTIDFHHSADPKDRSYTYIVDGKERPVGIWVENDAPRFIKATWEKSVLVIEYTAHLPAIPIDETARWSLSSDGRTLTEEIDKNPKLSYVYDKQ
jgi:hypothetical protein